MRTSVYFFALALVLSLAAIQPPSTQPSKPVLVPKTKVKPGNIKPIDPALTVPANADSLAAAEALRRAYAWLSPFSNYGLLSVESMSHLKSLDLSVGSPVINGIART